MPIQIKRAYDPPSQHDGLRVLVDRLWPRGLKKEDVSIDLWMKEIAPSSELRRWFGHQEDRFEEFARRYRRELDESEAAEIHKLVAIAQTQTVTLVYGAKHEDCNNAVVLRTWLEQLSRACPEHQPRSSD